MSLVHKIYRYFSVYSNQHHPVKEILHGREIQYDHNIQNYEKTIQAFLQKRKTQKQEIPPKMYIINQTIEGIADQLKQQKLVPFKQLYDQPRIEKLYQSKQINSQYIISISCEKHFKNMMDEYLQKVLVSGGVVPMKDLQEYNGIKERACNLYRTFFYGDKLSDMEKEIEIKYLVFKQQKFFKFSNKEKTAYKCIWTYSQQRRLELMMNWRARELNMYDDFRPIYEPFEIEKKMVPKQQIIEINGESITNRLSFKLFESQYYRNSKKKFQLIASYLITRSLLYCSSLEFSRVLNIPPDFHIEHSLLNLHIWMMIDRLKKINSVYALYMAKELELQFKKYTLEKVGKIHLKKKNDFIKDVNHFMTTNRNVYNQHFNETFKENPYKKIDALIWSTVFFEKVPRYSDDVYLMSEYVIQNQKYVQNLSQKTFEDCMVNFDVYRIDLDFREKILSVNPQLSPEEYEKELKSDKKIKTYYYNYKEDQNQNQGNSGTPIEKLPIDDDQQIMKQNEIKNRFFYGIFSKVRKFQNLSSYDYYNQREEDKKQKEQVESKYNWQTTEEDSEKLENLKKKKFKN